MGLTCRAIDFKWAVTRAYDVRFGPTIYRFDAFDVRNAIIALKLFFRPYSTSKIVLSDAHHLIDLNQVYQGWFFIFQPVLEYSSHGN